MNESPASAPPSSALKSESNERIIFVRISIPEALEAVTFAPNGNRIATSILCDLVKLAIETQGIRVSKARGFGEFNRAGFMFVVSELPGALSAIKSLLFDRLSTRRLLVVSQIAWFDPGELVIRTFYPTQGRLVALAEISHGLEADLHFYDAIQQLGDRLELAIKQLDPGADRPGKT